MERKERLDLELELLQKGRWGYLDVMNFYQVGKTVAYRIISQARANGGMPKYGFEREALTSKIVEMVDESTVLKEIEKRAMERKYLE